LGASVNNQLPSGNAGIPQNCHAIPHALPAGNVFLPPNSHLIDLSLDAGPHQELVKIVPGSCLESGSSVVEDEYLRAANRACERIAERAKTDYVDGRSAHNWLSSIIGYCKWRSGREWRLWEDRGFQSWRQWEANHPPFSPPDYDKAASLLNQLLTAPDRVPMGIATPVLNAEPGPSVEELKLREASRPSLVAELMALRPELTAKKSISKFTREKLARMVVEAREAALASLSQSDERRLA
jgi:hypothetical protein